MGRVTGDKILLDNMLESIFFNVTTTAIYKYVSYAQRWDYTLSK
jgi:hypothetical protein